MLDFGEIGIKEIVRKRLEEEGFTVIFESSTPTRRGYSLLHWWVREPSGKVKLIEVQLDEYSQKPRLREVYNY